MTITPELRQALASANGEPVRIEDPENHVAYILVNANAYAKMRPVVEPKEFYPPEVPPGLRLAQETFFRDLPAMLKDRKFVGKWVAYHRDRRISVGRREADVLAEVMRRRILDEEFCTFIVEPQSPEPEQVDLPSSWR
jgi:hypothetical protein